MTVINFDLITAVTVISNKSFATFGSGVEKSLRTNLSPRQDKRLVSFHFFHRGKMCLDVFL